MSVIRVPGRGVIRGPIGAGTFRLPPVVPPVIPAPVNSVLPTIAGTAQQNQILAATSGTWSGSPTFTYQWLRAGSAISGATSSSYTLVSADVGSVIAVAVTATNAGGSSTVTSSATATVIAASSGAAVIQATANIPTSGTALDPLGTGAMIVYQNIPIAYICLFHNGADEGTRQAFGGGGLPPLPPQDYANGGTYTIRLYDAATGGNLLYESPAITVAANPGQVGGSISAIYWPDGQIVTPATHGTSAMNQDGYWGLSGSVTEADLYLSSSSTQAPDVPAGAATIIGQSLNVTLQNVVTLYGSVRNMSQRPTYTGTAYLWMCVNGTDGTRSRMCHTSNPITIN